MKIDLKPERTTNTCTHSIYSVHNCPSCKCNTLTHIYRNTHHSPPYFHKICQPRFRQNNPYTNNPALSTLFTPNNNIYISKPTNIVPVAGRNINKIINSSVFDRRRDDYSESRSLARTNITFTYVSPSKEKQHRSYDAKFSTKQFKQKHFPFL
jgi:hypothetical protein